MFILLFVSFVFQPARCCSFSSSFPATFLLFLLLLSVFTRTCVYSKTTTTLNTISMFLLLAVPLLVSVFSLCFSFYILLFPPPSFLKLRNCYGLKEVPGFPSEWLLFPELQRSSSAILLTRQKVFRSARLGMSDIEQLSENRIFFQLRSLLQTGSSGI